MLFPPSKNRVVEVIGFHLFNSILTLQKISEISRYAFILIGTTSLGDVGNSPVSKFDLNVYWNKKCF